MEKSLDELIEHLLGEIAVCGPSGATVSDLTDFIDAFYYRVRDKTTANQKASPTQVIDDAFICSVWHWLSKQPDISFGKDNEQNTSLRTLLKPGSSIVSQSPDLPRIYVGNDRVYRAICGHEPDERRVFRSEYGLLVHIAAARSDGILQGDLGRIAGQDKRSVPKRTDSLHAKGYIVKEAVIIRGGHKSSRLTLRRFASASQLAHAADGSTESQSLERTVRDVVDGVIVMFRRKALIEVEALAEAVELGSEAGQKALNKILRVLVRAGFLKKVKAAIGASAHTGEPKPCYQRLREFDVSDLEGFNSSSNPLGKEMVDVLDDLDVQSPAANIEGGDGRMAQWNPDRNIANVLQQAVASAESEGLTNHGLRGLITGLSLKRPIESQLVRQSFAGPITQSRHLRHLAIFRINKGASGSPEYVHYPLASMEQVLSMGKGEKSSILVVRNIAKEVGETGALASAELDKFGFPVLLDDNLLQDGSAALSVCAKSSNAADLRIEDDVSEEETPRRKRGTGHMKRKSISVQPRLAAVEETPVNSDATPTRRKYTRRKVLPDQDDTVLGRPRKFLRGTEKFWQHHFWHARLDAEGPDTKRAGTMSHPIGKALFDNRPPRFDQVLVRAKEAGLPLPRSRDDISDAWVDQALSVLERKEPGGYVTPAGMHLSRVLYKSQVLILRSNKLNTLDFSARPKVYACRFLTSSAAHSYQNWRWFPSAHVAPKKGRKPFVRNLDVEHPTEFLEAFGQRPRAGIFYEPGGEDPTPSTPAPTRPKMTAEEYKALMDETDVDSELEKLMTPAHRAALRVASVSVEQEPQSPSINHTGAGVNDDAVEDQVQFDSKLDERTSNNAPDETSDSARAPPITHQTSTQSAVEDVQAPDEGHSQVAQAVVPVPITGQAEAQQAADTTEPRLTGSTASQSFAVPKTPRRKTSVRSRMSSASVSSRPVRRRRLTKKAAEWIDADRTASVGSPASSDVAVESDDGDLPSPAHSNTPSFSTHNGRQTISKLPANGVLATTESLQHPLTPLSTEPTVTHTEGDGVPNASSSEVNCVIALQECAETIINANAPVSHAKDQALPTSVTPEVAAAEPRSASGAEGVTTEPPVALRPLLKRKRSVSEAAGVDAGKNEPPHKALKGPHKSQAAACKAIIQELLRINDSIGPANPSVMRRATGEIWNAQGYADLPNLTTTKRAIESLVSTGQLKQHTFSFREPGGLMISRSILYPPSIQLTDPRIDQLKAALIEAGLKDYFPPTWIHPGVQRGRKPKIRTTSDNEEAELPLVQHAPSSTPASSRRRFRKSTPANIDEEPGVDIPSSPSSPASPSSPSRRGLRPRRQSSLITTDSVEDVPPMQSHDSSRKSSISSTSSAESPNLGFLTLKVPRLGALPQVKAFNEALIVPDHLREVPQLTIAKPKKHRKPRTPKVKETLLRKIIWQKHDLPTSLHDLLSHQVDSNVERSQNDGTTEASVFFQEVDLVAKWEERMVETLVNAKVPWTFISHTPDLTVESFEEPNTWKVVQPDDSGKLFERNVLDFESWLPFVQVRRKLGLSAGLESATTPTTSDGRVTRQATGSLRRKRRFKLDDGDFDVPDKRLRLDSDEAFGPDEDRTREKRAYVRKPKVVNSLETQYATVLAETSSDDILRIGMSVVVVSTLAGGPDRSVNWSIVHALHPKAPLKWLKSRWKAIEHIYAEELAALTANVRFEYLKAVQDEEVCMVNFADHADSDWTDILNWALAALPTFVIENILPSSQTELKEQYELSFGEPPTVRTMLVPYTNLRPSEREELASGISFSYAVSQHTDSALSDQARAIILSTLLAPSFAHEERAKTNELLTSISTDVDIAKAAASTALAALVADQLLTKTDGSVRRTPPLLESNKRAYILTDKMSDIFDNRHNDLIITRSLLQEATTYKLEVLDPAVEAGEQIRIPNRAQFSNGQILALYNLLAAGLIAVEPGADSKKSRYGISWPKVGYMTRQIEQSELGFEVVVQPTEAYRSGDLIPGKQPVLPPPAAHDAGHWPMWAMLPSGEADAGLWQKVLAAVVGMVHMRPGAPVSEIRETMSGIVTDREIQTVLEWAERSGFLKQYRLGVGWTTTKCWWWCVGTG